MFMHIIKLVVQRRLFIGLLIAMLYAFYVHGAAGAVYYVDDDAAWGGDGRSWATAYKYLQDALYDSALGYGDTIRVAAGTYTPDKDERGIVISSDPNATFQLVNGVELYGGYAGVSGEDPNERNPDTYVSVLSGDLAGNDGSNFVNYAENSFHVVTGSGTEPNTLLDGFTISGGNATGDDLDSQGAGMLNFNGSPTVTNCIFTENTSIDIGGGMYNYYYSSPTVTYCIFKDNHADKYGGGMDNDAYCSPTVIACTFNGNTSTNGGGIDNYFYCNPTVTDCTFSNNSATIGGGMSNWSSSPMVTKCTFIGNMSAESGGGIYNNASGPTLTNCIFVGNTVTLTGGGMYNYNSSPIVNNCTFSRNTASQYGGGIYNRGDSYPVITNVILWDNTAPTGAEIYNYSETSIPTVNYSDVQGSWEGAGNLDSDPLFADPGTGDFHLKSEAGRWDPATQAWVLDAVTSPCIDAGNPASDWAEEVCPNGVRINMGAYGGTAQASHSMPDFNYDAIINLVDYSRLANKWLAENDIQNVDLDCNGIVDMIDLKILLDNYLWGL
jgi:predicted outer membrane repeat protein